MFPVLICPQISACAYVCPAFLVCGSVLSENRPCMWVCQTLRFRSNQLNKASGGPHSGSSLTRKHFCFRVRIGMMQLLLPVVHTPGLDSWRRSLTRKHISSNTCHIAAGEPVPWRRSLIQKQNGPELSMRSSKSCTGIKSLYKGF